MVFCKVISHERSHGTFSLLSICLWVCVCFCVWGSSFIFLSAFDIVFVFVFLSVFDIVFEVRWEITLGSFFVFELVSFFVVEVKYGRSSDSLVFVLEI